MNLSEIHFSSRISLEEHARYSGFKSLLGLPDFAAYREVFERGWAEISIMCGEGLNLLDLKISGEPPDSTLLVNLMGANLHAPRRVRFAKEFFDAYESVDKKVFLREFVFRTEYVKDILGFEEDRIADLKGIRLVRARNRIKKNVNYRISSFLNLYENMKKFGTIVGDAHKVHERVPLLSSMDLPWAIDYFGYIKLREGAHRRAIANYLGWETIPTLVFDFGQVTRGVLKEAHPYIRDNFKWFAELVRMAAILYPGNTVGEK
jgi:hypothetical protein